MASDCKPSAAQMRRWTPESPDVQTTTPDSRGSAHSPHTFLQVDGGSRPLSLSGRRIVTSRERTGTPRRPDHVNLFLFSGSSGMTL